MSRKSRKMAGALFVVGFVGWVVCFLAWGVALFLKDAVAMNYAFFGVLVGWASMLVGGQRL